MKIRIYNTSERILPHCVVVLRCVVVDYDVALATSWLCLYISELSEPEGKGGDRPSKFWQISQPYLNQERTDYAHHISTLPRPRIFRPSYGPDCTWLYLPHHLQRKNAAGRLVLINSRPHSTVRDCGSK